MFLMIKHPEINMKAEIGNILRGTGISRQFPWLYIHLKQSPIQEKEIYHEF
jgi:hypothetical protein